MEDAFTGVTQDSVTGGTGCCHQWQYNAVTSDATSDAGDPVTSGCRMQSLVTQDAATSDAECSH